MSGRYGAFAAKENEEKIPFEVFYRPCARERATYTEERSKDKKCVIKNVLEMGRQRG